MKQHAEIQQYIDQINSKISFKEAHPEIAQEIASHIEESIFDAKSHFADEAQALRHAIQKMGDAGEIGNKLNTIHRDEINWQLIVITIAIFATGLFAMSAFGKLALHVTWGVFGVLVAGALVFVRPTALKRNSLSIYFSSVALTALCWKFAVLYEGQPYLMFGMLKINVVNFLFIPLLVATAGLVERFQTKRGPILLLLLTLIPIAGLVELNALYLALTLVLAILGMMGASSTPKWISMAFSTVSLFLIFGSNQSSQFIGGPNVSQAMVSEAHTDFILAYLQSHYPILFLVVLALGAMLTIQALYATKEIKSTYSRTLVTGGLIAVAFSFGFGALTNLGFVAMPVSGVTIPFVSYGGSLTIGFFALIGVLVSVYRRKSLVRI